MNFKSTVATVMACLWLSAGAYAAEPIKIAHNGTNPTSNFNRFANQQPGVITDEERISLIQAHHRNEPAHRGC